jgi:hypothetical protein
MGRTLNYEIMKYILAISLILGLFAVILCWNNPLVVKWLFGEAFYLGKPKNIQINHNGVLSNKFEVYRKIYNTSQSSIDLEKAYFLIKRKKWHSVEDGIKVFIVDTSQRTIFLTSDSNIDFVKRFGRLWQSKASHNVLIDIRDDVKGINFEPDLIYSNSSYYFNLPSKLKGNNTCIDKFEIIF